MPAADRIERAFAANVRAYRERTGLTQEQLAALLGVEARTVRRIESGSVNCSIVTVARVADALGVEPHTLLMPASFGRRKPGRPRRPSSR